MHLDRLKTFSNLKQIEGYIQEVYNSSEDRYIPAIINEGSFIESNGEDFYLKLILLHVKTKFKKTWLKENLRFGLSDPDFGSFNNEIDFYDYFIENVITWRKVKGNNLYQLNPNIVSESIEEDEYDNNVMVKAFYFDEYTRVKGKHVLKTEDNKNIFVLKDVLLPYINDLDNNIYPKYVLAVEYEYRTHNKCFGELVSGIHKTNNGTHDLYTDDSSIQLKGSFKIKLCEDNTDLSRNVDVISLDSLKIREHTPNNLDDDINAGLVIFKKEIINILKADYYFYDLMIIDKYNVNDTYLIDILDDMVVFWEGEYNKLPNDIKDKIEVFNYVPSEIKGIISPGMMAWQLEADWNYYKKLYPEQLLAMEIRENYFNSAIEIGITFLIPNTLTEFKNFIINIEKITGIKLSLFNSKHEDVLSIINICTDKIKTMEPEVIELLYRKYCYQIYKVIKNGHDN